MNAFAWSKVASVVVGLAACGGTKVATKIPAPEVSPTAHTALVAQLNAMRPFVVTEADSFRCDLYTSASTAALKELVTKTEAAKLERLQLTAQTLTTWQTKHQVELGQLIDQVSTPLRKATTCKPVVDEHAWARVAEAIVAIGEPLQIPAAIAKRRAEIENLLVQATKVQTVGQCEGFQKSMTASFGALEGDLKAMPRIEQFVDNLVWEKADEELLQKDARIADLMKICGAESENPAP
ncbi:MAG: hypothetical protein KBG15_22175 [Kofleriaceae bacterium]|nr:hypothetical protein [Kofleriaceae bacterium]